MYRLHYSVQRPTWSDVTNLHHGQVLIGVLIIHSNAINIHLLIKVSFTHLCVTTIHASLGCRSHAACIYLCLHIPYTPYSQAWGVITIYISY